MRRRIVMMGTAGCALLAVPAPASAHGIVGRADLPIPAWLFAWGAAVVLVVSFVALAALWRRPLLEDAPSRPVLTLPGFVDPLCGAIGIVLFVGLVYAGFAGSQTPTNNILPTFVYVLVWVALVPLCAVFGDLFRPFNPWRAAARGAVLVARRTAGRRLPEPLPYPRRLGYWPAAIGLLAFGWLELVYADGNVPQVLATCALIYAAIQFVGMSLYGVSAWTSRGDTFAVYFGLFAGLSPLAVEDGRIVLRRPAVGLARIALLPGIVAFACVAIGVTMFDGASEGDLWSSAAGALQQTGAGLGLSLGTALQGAFTVGLLACVLVVAGIYRLGVAGMRSATDEGELGHLSRRFAPSLVPIALAYVVAHYFSLVVFQGQATAYLASDPLGNGADLLGTATLAIDYTVISATAIWYVQVATLVVGHAAALAVAHDRALADFSDRRVATRSQQAMLAVMVGFTCLGLWLLSAASA